MTVFRECIPDGGSSSRKSSAADMDSLTDGTMRRLNLGPSTRNVGVIGVDKYWQCMVKTIHRVFGDSTPRQSDTQPHTYIHTYIHTL